MDVLADFWHRTPNLYDVFHYLEHLASLGVRHVTY